ncbi:hypothetical protein MMC07_006896 [Pseudocyphellaria aurata]|nr:hypothetical protein [Pseudocyphellaria aurata]
MAQVGLDERFPLPQVAQSLAPYIKPRQEALRIRRILSVFLAQNIDPTTPLSRTSLAVPSEDARIRRIPPEVSGIRKKYLKALHAHVMAREEYEQFAQGPDEDAWKAMRQEQQEIDNDASAHVTTYLELLQAQRKYQKLRILQHYLDLLARKNAAKSDYLTVESISKEISQPPELLSTASAESSSRISSSKDTIQSLTLYLEKAVLRAQNAAEKERQLLAQVKNKQRYEGSSGDSNCPDTSAEIFALSKTRDELIGWIEQNLGEGDQSEDSHDKDSIIDRERTSLDVDQRKKAIEVKYEDYLHTRKSLVDAISKRRALPTHKLVKKQEDTDSYPISKSNETSTYEATLVLPYLTEHIIPASIARKGFLQQESHLSKMLADQSQETVKVLQRMADESHLLSNYPLLATQPRFQNTVAALGSRLRPTIADGTESRAQPEAQSVTQARAWALSATTARSVKHDELQERLDHGNKHVEIAKERIKELKDVLGVESEAEETEDQEEDFPMESGAKNTKQRPMKKGQAGGRDSLGIWAGLDGNIRLDNNSPND